MNNITKKFLALALFVGVLGNAVMGMEEKEDANKIDPYALSKIPSTVEEQWGALVKNYCRPPNYDATQLIKLFEENPDDFKIIENEIVQKQAVKLDLSEKNVVVFAPIHSENEISILCQNLIIRGDNGSFYAPDINVKVNGTMIAENNDFKREYKVPFGGQFIFVDEAPIHVQRKDGPGCEYLLQKLYDQEKYDDLGNIINQLPKESGSIIGNNINIEANDAMFFGNTIMGIKNVKIATKDRQYYQNAQGLDATAFNNALGGYTYAIGGTRQPWGQLITSKGKLECTQGMEIQKRVSISNWLYLTNMPIEKHLKLDFSIK
ncbi:MAG: hypothetical protein ACTSXG_00895 [Alphaproteobacteria bacterium]